jgi:hypothetical protein
VIQFLVQLCDVSSRDKSMRETFPHPKEIFTI